MIISSALVFVYYLQKAGKRRSQRNYHLTLAMTQIKNKDIKQAADQSRTRLS